MKKQDNESLIQELTSRLDWYMMEASDEEFDAEQVQALMKLLDSLKSEEEKIEELPVEEAAEDFWKYCEEREAEERLLRGAEESETSDHAFDGKQKEERKESKFRGLLRFFHRHRLVAVTAAVLVVIVLGGSWQAVANAEKHGGFFWWMDKSEEGTAMITSPEGIDDYSENKNTEYYYKVEDVPEEYRRYAEMLLELPTTREYKLDVIKTVKRQTAIAMYVYLQDSNNKIYFEIKIYPKEVLRIKEKYVGYSLLEEYEKDGITYGVFKKEELDGDLNYIVYFYYGNVKYATVGKQDEKLIKKIASECGEAVRERDSY